jgi:hypothetical protein
VYAGKFVAGHRAESEYLPVNIYLPVNVYLYDPGKFAGGDSRVSDGGGETTDGNSDEELGTMPRRKSEMWTRRSSGPSCISDQLKLDCLYDRSRSFRG